MTTIEIINNALYSHQLSEDKKRNLELFLINSCNLNEKTTIELLNIVSELLTT